MLLKVPSNGAGEYTYLRSGVTLLQMHAVRILLQYRKCYNIVVNIIIGIALPVAEKLAVLLVLALHVSPHCLNL